MNILPYRIRQKLAYEIFDYATRHVFESPILQCKEQSGFSIVTQVCERDLAMYLIGIKSFCRFVAPKRVVVLDDGREFTAGAVVSGLDPKRTFLDLVDEKQLPDDFVRDIRRFKIRGSSGKVNLSLDALPDFTSKPGIGPLHKGAVSVSPSIDYLERAYDEAKYGDFSSRSAASAPASAVEHPRSRSSTSRSRSGRGDTDPSATRTSSMAGRAPSDNRTATPMPRVGRWW